MTTPTQVLAARAAEHPDRVVIRMDAGGLTYRTLDIASQDIATWLAGAGIGAGDRVATMFGNEPEAVMTWFGVERSGAVEVPINTALSGRLLAEQLETSRPKLVLASSEYVDTMTDGVRLAGIDATVREVGRDASGVRTSGSVAPIDDDLATAMILFTSGTTGRSKGVVLPHRSTMRLSKAMVEHVGLHQDDVLQTSFPLFHIAARFVSVVSAMLCDGEVLVQRRFSATKFWDTCRAEGVTAIHYLGTVPMMLYNQPQRDDDTDHPVRIAYGAGLPPSVAADFETRFGLTTRELYGSTEQGMVAINREGAMRIGSCGTPLDDVDLQIQDDAGTSVASETWGEIVVRPRTEGLFFDGYDGMPDATEAAWRGGWFHTGDLGKLDTDGYLWFGGRIKEAIRRRGENISAWEVERTVNGFPAVTETAAIGVPSPLGDEELMVVVAATESPDWDALAAHCGRELPHYAVPRYYRHVEALPRTPTGRVKKVELAGEGVTSDTHDRTNEGALQ